MLTNKIKTPSELYEYLGNTKRQDWITISELENDIDTVDRQFLIDFGAMVDIKYTPEYIDEMISFAGSEKDALMNEINKNF